ncbi:fatty acid desaturase [Pendulispora brunnea]|uniref:Fatty acid desaturase n=1 Tax=Pendulispora brunnea TaxID=2905690 RepID=A0ABZ2JY51_9BACT
MKSIREPDALELDIPGEDPGASAENRAATKFETRAPASRTVDLTFAVIVTFFPPIAFAGALYLHFQGWYRIGFIDIALMLMMWFLSVTGIEVGYHRLFSHCSYKAHPAVRRTLAALGSMGFQGPVIWWASIHRKHHRTSDKPGDPHSMYLFGTGPWALFRGFIHSHVGWIWTGSSIRFRGLERYVSDLYRDEDIFRVHMHYFRWLAAGFIVPAIIGGVVRGSWQGAFLGFLWGGFVRVFFMNHLTYWCTNTVTHSRLGRRAYHTSDRSSNSLLLAIPTLGQTFHNNHHAFPSSAIMGHEWWQIDVGTWILRALERLGWVWDVRVPDERMMAKKRIVERNEEHRT